MKFVSITTKESLERKVISIKIYKSIDDLFEKENYKHIFPDAETEKEAKECYKKFPNFLKKVDEFGIVAFMLG